MINSNTNKTNVEELVNAEASIRQSADNGLSSRISTLEGKHIYSHNIKAYFNEVVVFLTILDNDASQYYFSKLSQWLITHNFTDDQNSIDTDLRRYPCSGAGSSRYAGAISSPTTNRIKVYFGGYMQESSTYGSAIRFSDNVIQLL